MRMPQSSVQTLLMLSAASLLVACTPARVPAVNSTTDAPRVAEPVVTPTVPFDGSAAGEEDVEPEDTAGYRGRQ